MTDDLDTRARSAAEGLRRAVADVPVPTAAPSAHRPRRAPLVLAAALVAVVVALVVVGDDEGTEVATGPTSPATGIPRLVLDPVPDGLEPTGAVDLPQGDPAYLRYVYAVAPVAPGSAPDVALTVTTVDQGLQAVDEILDRVAEAGSATTVDGHPAAFGPDPLDPERQVVVVDVDGHALVDLGAPATFDTLLLLEGARQAVAGGVVDDPSIVDDPGVVQMELPGGLSLLGGGPVSVPVEAGLPIPLPWDRGHVVGYQDVDGGDAVVAATVAGDAGDLATMRWRPPGSGPDPESVEIRGATGWVIASSADATVLAWPETADAIGVLLASGSVEEAVALADLLRPATDEEWAALPRSSVAAGEAVAPPDALAAVSSSEGTTSWTAYVDADGSLCLEVVEDSRSTGMCSESPSEPLEVDAIELADGSWVIYGATTFDPTTVRIEGEGADPGFSVAVLEDGGVVFATGEAVDEPPAAVRVVDQVTGEVLARAEVIPGGRAVRPVEPTTTTTTAAG